jgi:hypothetical protein
MAQPKVRSEGRLGTNTFALFAFFAVQSSLLRHPYPTMTRGLDCPSTAAAISKIFNRKERKWAGNRPFVDAGRRTQWSVPVERQWRALNSPVGQPLTP